MREDRVETKLVDAAEVLDRFRKPINSTERDSRQGSIPYYGANGQTGWIDDFLFDEELVLLGEDAIDFADPSARKAYLITGPSWVNNHAHVLRAKLDLVDSYFLAESLNKVDFSQYVSFGTRSKLTQASMNGIKILLPPLPEQKRIVDLISSVDSYIEALQQQLESAKKSRNAVLHALLTAGGEDWVEKTLDLVTECSWGNTETTKSKYVDSGYLAYSASGADGFLDWFEHDRTAVVLSAIGAQCGKTWFAEGKWTSIKNTIWLKADNLNLLDKYLFYLSNRDQFWQIRGQAQPFISLGDVKKTKVLLPPIVEQERIIQVISGIDSFQDSLTACLNSSKNLRAGILSSLLSGEHEIPASYDKVIGAA
jgi:type I restriction enzyme S subunit